MKKEFGWYFPAEPEELEHVWDIGLLTVDANVLLDIYRYHETTRNSLLSTLQKFEGRLWLSHQASEEFIRNRAKVIVSAEKTFQNAITEVDKLKKSLSSVTDQLRGNRLIPSEVDMNLTSGVMPSIEKAEQEILQAKDSYPNYFKYDPILEKIATMFHDAVGEPFSGVTLESELKEADRRKEEKIPPGFLDSDKDGERPMGDYLLWKQILNKAKADSKPMIFVTSERKEDWWQKISGRTIGPLPDLMKESLEFSGQRVLIYQTDHFLEFTTSRFGEVIDKNAVEEIRAIDSQRTKLEPAVLATAQVSKITNNILHEGLLSVNLGRPVRNFTASGALNPAMLEPPALFVKLIEQPERLPEFQVSCGTGTTYGSSSLTGDTGIH